MESKIKTDDNLSDPLLLMFPCQGCLTSMVLYNIMDVVLVNFNNPDKRTKGDRRPQD